MKGSEVLTKRKSTTTIGSAPPTLSEIQKQDIVLYFGTAGYDSILSLIETLVVRARDEAMMVDPSEENKQRAKMTIAHAVAQLYLDIKSEVDFIIQEHHGKIKAKVALESVRDEDELARIILDPINSGH